MEQDSPERQAIFGRATYFLRDREGLSSYPRMTRIR